MRKFLLSVPTSILIFLSSIQSGHAINIAIVDTGMDPAILGGVLEPEGFDFFNNDSDPSDDSPEKHGTNAGHVAINSGTNITLTDIKAFNGNSETTDAVMEAAFDYIATLSGVRVVSHDGAGVANTPTASLVAVAAANKIIAMAAGNGGGPEPVADAAKVALLGGNGIVVGGVNSSGTDIQPASNRAGSLADHFILAQSNALLSSAISIGGCNI